MIKKIIILCVIYLSTGRLLSQQEPVFSQNYQNNVFYNPAIAGKNGICANLIAKQQWVGFEGQPETYILSANMPIKQPYFGFNHGVGITIISDKLGQESNTGIKLSYAFKSPKKIGLGILSGGVSLGILNKSIGDNWIFIERQDPSIPVSTTASTKLDVDLGLFYDVKGKYSFGISFTHFNQPNFSDETTNNNISSSLSYGEKRHLFITGEYIYHWSAKIVLKPNLYIASDGVRTTFNFGAIGEYKEFLFGGIVYRLKDAISPVIGAYYSLKGEGLKGGKFKFGYSYDITTSALRKQSSGSHEFNISYCFTIPNIVKINKYRNVRYL